MRRHLTLRLLATLAAALFLSIGSATARAEFYNFYKITDNNEEDVGSQLFMEVTDAGNGQVMFEFTNQGPIGSGIADIYFDDGFLIGIASIDNSDAGVSFSSPATPPVLPGGNSVGFISTKEFSSDSDVPVADNAIDPGESLRITFDLINGNTFADTILALSLDPNLDPDTEWLRIGLHVQKIGVLDGSDGYINYPAPLLEGPTLVPEPGAVASLAMLLFSVIGVYGFARRRGLAGT